MSLKPLKSKGTILQLQLKEGNMTSVLESLKKRDPRFKKYEKVTDIPDKLLPKYLESLVRRYDYATAVRMVNIQIIYRKNRRDPKGVKERKKFQKMLQILQKMNKR